MNIGADPYFGLPMASSFLYELSTLAAHEGLESYNVDLSSGEENQSWSISIGRADEGTGDQSACSHVY